jgi:hypothetical protein
MLVGKEIIKQITLPGRKYCETDKRNGTTMIHERLPQDRRSMYELYDSCSS